MLISYNELCEFVERGVIGPVDPKDINGTSIDVHLGPKILVERCYPERSYPTVSLRDKENVHWMEVDITEAHYDLQPGEFILAHTVEVFDLPADISAEFKLNSSGARIGLDNALATWCFTGETEIALLSGDNVAIKDLVGRNDVWVYALDKEARFVPAKASCVFQSGTVSETVVVTLDDGASFECTPEHRIMLRDGSYRKASELQPDDAVMPLYRKLEGEHEKVYSPKGCRTVTESHIFQGAFVPTHRAVWEYFNGAIPEGRVVHHVDFDPLNNHPENLELLTAAEHIGVHAKARMSSEQARMKASEHMRKVNSRLWQDPAFVERKLVACSEQMKALNAKQWSDPKHIAKMKPIQRATALKHLCKVDQALVQRAAKLGMVKSALRSIYEAGENVSRETYAKYKRQNAPTITTLEKTFGSFEAALQEAGYSNHKVASVVHKTHKEPVPVFDMTVPEHHNFALASGVFVHNCDPRWHGSTLTLELKNNTRYHIIRLHHGCRIGQMIFHRSEPVPEEKSYAVRGRYNKDASAQPVKE